MGAERLPGAMMANGGIGFLLFYKIAIEILYYHYVAHGPWWWGAPYDASFDITEYWVSWCVSLIILFICRSTWEKPLNKYHCSEFILLMLLLISVLPGMAMCGVGAFPSSFSCLYYAYWLFFFFVVRGLVYGKTRLLGFVGQLSHKTRGRLLFVIGIIVVSTVVFVFIYYNGGNFFVAGIQSTEIYTVRLQFREIVMPVLVNYVMANASIILLLLLMFLLQQKRYELVGVICLVQYMNFSCGASKLILLSMLLVLLVYAFRDYITARKIIGIGILIVIAATVEGYFWKGVFLPSFINRISFLPAYLNYCYYDYFQVHASVVDLLLGEPIIDNRAVNFIIGQKYFGQPLMSANNGFLGDAVRIFGDGGVIIHPILWCIYLYFLDWVSNGIDWRMKFGVSIYWAVVMQDSFITTSLFTHGGLALMGMVYLVNRRRKDVTVTT